MRDIKLPMNQTQKLRLQRALEKLESFSSKVNSNSIVAVGDTIPVNLEDSMLKGHGTLELNDEVVATACGVVERVNKLIYVRSLRSRYKPETGDIVVGRVVEVAQKCWKIDINANLEAVLLLSSINMPDGIQRRRTALDELNMRNIFIENDVICAEVRNIQHDGSIQLQARSEKYGKFERGQLLMRSQEEKAAFLQFIGFERGQLLSVPSYLVKRRKQHFYNLEDHPVTLVLGCNGFIWVGEQAGSKDMNVEVDEDGDSTIQELSEDPVHTPLETRKIICRIANAVRVLCNLGFSITKDVIMSIVELSISKGVDVHDMLGSEFCVVVAEKEAEKPRSRK